MSDEKTELRGMTPRDVVDVIDAVSTAKRITRMDLVNQILGEWVSAKLHESILVHRVMRGNPLLPEADGVKAERR